MGWEGDGMEGEVDREGERGRRDGRGSLGRGKKGGKGNGGDKSPAWSSQDLRSTEKNFDRIREPHFALFNFAFYTQFRIKISHFYFRILHLVEFALSHFTPAHE